MIWVLFGGLALAALTGTAGYRTALRRVQDDAEQRLDDAYREGLIDGRWEATERIEAERAAAEPPWEPAPVPAAVAAWLCPVSELGYAGTPVFDELERAWRAPAAGPERARKAITA